MTGPVVPEAKEALNKFKMQAANEVGVNLKDGYNGDLTSREAGSRRRPDGQEDDRVLREGHEVTRPGYKAEIAKSPLTDS